MTDSIPAPVTEAPRTDRAAELALDTYRLLGRSGLRVSPLALGNMTTRPGDVVSGKERVQPG